MVRRRYLKIYFFLLLLCSIVFEQPIYAALVEQLMYHPKSIAMGNAVTACPPGIMSVYFNPAGLMQLRDGKTVSVAAPLAYMHGRARFINDPEFEGFFSGSFKGDPIANTQGETTAIEAYVPLYNNTVKLPAAGMPSPMLGWKPPGKRYAFGLAMYTPLPGGVAWGGDDNPARHLVSELYMQHMVVAPGVAYQLSDKLSVGASVGMGQSFLGTKMKDMRSPSDMVAMTKVIGESTEGLEIPIVSELTFPPPWFGGGIGPWDPVADAELEFHDGFTPNYNIGILYNATDWLSLGAVYQSEMEIKFTGSYKLSYRQNWQNMIGWFGSAVGTSIISGILDLPTDPVPYQEGYASLTFPIPQRIQLGMQIRPLAMIPKLKGIKFSCDAAWNNYSRISGLKINFDQSIQFFKFIKLLGYGYGDKTMFIKQYMKDTWHFSYGLEIDVHRNQTIRLGYERRVMSVRDELWSFQTMVPPVLNMFGVGGSIKFKNGVEIENALGYYFGTYYAPNDSSTNLNSLSFNEPVYNPYAGLNVDYRLDVIVGSLAITLPFEVMDELVHDMFSAILPGH